MSVRKSVVVLYRLCWITFLVMVVSFSIHSPFPYWLTWVPAAAAFALLLVAGRKARAAAADPRPAVEVGAPVSGRWAALNSPADKVPSHGVHAYGQTYAIDIVAEPEGGSSRPEFRRLWPVARRNHHFPAFGASLLAVADGTVVRASHGRRDHLSRNSVPALIYLTLIEGAVRGVLGPGSVVGNHLVLDLGNGTYAMYAHLRRGSLRVRAGEAVRAGQILAECGNSGNSTEPHVHFQLMDDPDLDVAIGIPFIWHGIGVPANGETFTAGGTVGGRRVAESGPTQGI
ncbi:M23 family metallopeptidase [Streptomyces sp. NPDC050529]|uniref:M23 family metallopeptidase n=1 Tax=unclassified Streptomyces TaxID=2593676 RepID=UPI002DD82D3A|nr:M23 family metallopeptidase [Streptomyces sp. NBC_01022]WRZ87198.1 M23 family metallopeptidase [Streptomyces sp. NBC_01022]